MCTSVHVGVEVGHIRARLHIYRLINPRLVTFFVGCGLLGDDPRHRPNWKARNELIVSNMAQDLPAGSKSTIEPRCCHFGLTVIRQLWMDNYPGSGRWDVTVLGFSILHPAIGSSFSSLSVRSAYSTGGGMPKGNMLITCARGPDVLIPCRFLLPRSPRTRRE
ncbi:hypothetical protein BJ138DRAFT_1155236 [Hygrophoropsis aurantiaca]|uniref:Uncharacterized protein n=1 Tax=Hygrophoropsis aurantiaca TaxID=72124 RepID=A0ACB8A8T2_9AGAM|nr:hypothetical protein BJ138DRAFT_1155236 [Hygrophoropsis aurantiaca]